MRWFQRAGVFGLVTAVAMTAGPLGAAQETATAKPAALPTPPQQGKPWEAPEAAIPAELLSATTKLFDQGLADPRGCEYRSVTLVVGSCWDGGGGTVDVHAWLLPGDGATRYAVGWNGVVFAATAVGEPADLVADVEALIKADAQMRAEWEKERPDWGFTRYLHAPSEARSASQESMLPLKVCLLLRLGRGELAAKYWKHWAAGLRPRTNNNDEALEDPYLLLAQYWAWAHFDRALCAHMRGDDERSLRSAQVCARIGPLVEAEAKNRGYRQRAGWNDDPVPYLGFLYPVEAILRDQTRRAGGEARAPLPDETASVEDRIAALIDRLDEVAARQWGQPGSVDPIGDPLVQQLVEMGTPAIDALIDCYTNDERLTRSAGFGRDFAWGRYTVPVRRAALRAILGILDDFEITGASWSEAGFADSKADIAKCAKALREYWARHRGASEAERWYRVLQNDKASPQAWLEAATNITTPRPTGFVERDDKRPIRGEELRAKNDPTVLELFARRAEQLSKFGELGSERNWNMHKACDIALCAGKWEPAKGGTLLREQTLRAIESWRPQDRAVMGGNEQLIARVGDLTLAWAAHEKDLALETFGAWVVNVLPSDADHLLPKPWHVFWTYPEHPAITKAAEKMLLAEDSAWLLRAGDQRGDPWGNVTELMHSPLIRLPAYQVVLHRWLQDKTEIGTVSFSEQSLSFKLKSGHDTSGTAHMHPNAPTSGKPRPIRKCDWAAFHLSKLDGSPLILLDLAERDRDEAIQQMRDWLTEWGPQYREGRKIDNWGDWTNETPGRLAFALLDAPATEEDVETKRAIFALEGERRVVPLEGRPRLARWAALRRYPYRARERVGNTEESRRITKFLQDGLVWQVEEVREGDTWKRYYGIVARHEIARVPAEEIEFPVSHYWWWRPGERAWDLSILSPGFTEPDERAEPAELHVGDPVTITIWARNRLGAPRAVPAAGKGAHIELELWYAAQSIEDEAGGEYAPRDQDAWKQVPVAEGQSSLLSWSASPKLEPTEHTKLAEADLAARFPVTEPGWYRVTGKVVSTTGPTGELGPREIRILPRS